MKEIEELTTCFNHYFDDKDFICDDFISYFRKDFVDKDEELIKFVCSYYMPKIKKLIRLMHTIKQERIAIKDKAFPNDMSFEEYQITLMMDLSYRIAYVKFINDEGVLSFNVFLKRKGKSENDTI